MCVELLGERERSAPQDIVRLTFKAFHDVLKAQGEAIKVRNAPERLPTQRSPVPCAREITAAALPRSPTRMMS